MTPPTPPPEIEAAITAAAWSIAELDRRADVMAQPEIGALRTAITSALAAAREAGRREVLERARHLSIGEGVGDATPIEKALQLYREETMEWENCDHPSGAAKDAERRQFDAYLALFAAIAADKAALDATWRAHDLERDAEVAQAQAATHEACAALQAICAALHVAPPTGSTYCAEAVAMVLAALTGADAHKPTQCGAVDMLRGTICPTCGARKEFAPGPPTGEIRRQMDAAAVEMCADCAALAGAGGGR